MTDETETPAAPTRADILRQAIAARQSEIESYDINVDGYELQIADIDANYPPENEMYAEMQEHRKRLLELAVSEKREREKSRLALRAQQAMLDKAGE